MEFQTEHIEAGIKLAKLFLLVFASGLMFDVFVWIVEITGAKDTKWARMILAIFSALWCYLLSYLSGVNTLGLDLLPLFLVLSFGFIIRNNEKD